MQDLSKLLFELSNEDRLKILCELKKNPLKLSRVSEKFDFTVPETARNMTRLTEASLITKDLEGYFHLTPVGEEALRLLPGFEFLSKHKKYFKTHTLSTLRPEHQASIGLLVHSEFTNEITSTLFNIENTIREAEKFVWVMTDQVPASVLPIFIEGFKRGVECRKIMPRAASIPQGIFAMANDPAFARAARENKLESRYVDKIDVAIALSEKEVGAVIFPDLEGKFDFSSFRSKHEGALIWATSLFQYYWDRAKRELTG